MTEDEGARSERAGMGAKPDCRRCGLCCISLTGERIWAEVDIDDAERLGSAWCKRHVIGHDVTMQLIREAQTGRKALLGGIETVWREVKTGPLAGVEVCACVALRGSVMNRVSCRVYDRRPKICKTALTPGEPACLRARAKVEQDLGLYFSDSGS